MITFKSLKTQMFNVFIRIITLNVEVSEPFDITIETTEEESIFEDKPFFHNIPLVRCLCYWSMHPFDIECVKDSYI